MGTGQGRNPLLPGRGALLLEAFCRHTGLDQETDDELLRTVRLEGALVRETDPTHVVMIPDDVLPTRESLIAMGLPVKDGYEPEALRSTLLDEIPDPDDS